MSDNHEIYSLIDQFVDSHVEELIETRRYLHSNPEVSGCELETTQFIIDNLNEKEFQKYVLPNRCGLYVDLGNMPNKKFVAVRCDIDALPISDQKKVKYASKSKGVMHACGHDAHTAILIFCMKALHSVLDKTQLNIRGIFQPSEELITGADEMISNGSLLNVSRILGIHVDPDLSVGKVRIKSGTLCASCIDFRIHLTGKTGHAAYPSNASDPIFAMCSIVMNAYQTIYRVLDPIIPSVITFCEISSGVAINVIPEKATLAGTIRSHKYDEAKKALQFLKSILDSVESNTGVKCDLSIIAEVNSLENDLNTACVVENQAANVLGNSEVITNFSAMMGAEDFAQYLKHVPGAMMRLGTDSHRIKKCTLHESHFDIDENALAIGVKILSRSVIDLNKI